LAILSVLFALISAFSKFFIKQMAMLHKDLELGTKEVQGLGTTEFTNLIE